MNEFNKDKCDELWRRLVEAESAFYAARASLFSSCRNQLVDLVRKGLENPSHRVTALGLVEVLTIEERQQLLPDLLSLACCCHGLTVDARELVLELPREWLIQNIEQAAEPLLGFDDYEEYRGLFQIYLKLDLTLARKLAKRAANHYDADIKDAADDFSRILKDLQDSHD